jgi:hypothetical protein
MSMAESFAKSAFAKFINTPTGRIARIISGLVIIVWGYTQSGGIVLIIIGLIPLVAGAFNLCLISALLGGTISGAKIAKGNQK